MSGRAQTVLIAGCGLVLLYVLPLYFPPPAQPLIATAPDAGLFERLFPNVPRWWMLLRLAALFGGAALIAAAIARPVVRLPSPIPTLTWRYPWVRPAALLAALLHVASLAYLPALPQWAQYGFVLWLAVPGALLFWGMERRAAATQTQPRNWTAGVSVGAIILAWLATRLPMSWHSPLAADGVDMWRTFGRLVQIVASGENFLTAPMDPQLPGVTCYELLNHGLPILQLFSLTPTLTFSQVNAALLLALAAVEVAVLCALVVGRGAAPVAVATFLFSPLVLIFQLYPLSAPAWLMLATLLALMVVQFHRSGSPALLPFIGAAAGLTSSFPTLLPMTALAAALTARRSWQRPRQPVIVVATAGLVFVVGFLAGFGIRDITAFREMVSRYYFLHWSWAIGELAMQGQMSPTIYDWTAPAPPPWPVIPIGALLSPFAIARNGLRLWGDAMFEPLSIGLFTAGIAISLRQIRRDPMSLLMIALLGAAMIGGVTSTYDRPSQLRLLGASIPLALLAAGAFKGIADSVPSIGAKSWAGLAVGSAIAAGGTFLFDIVNPSILPASSLGLTVRSLSDADVERAVILTAEGFHPNTNASPLHRFGHMDWLRTEHPYIDEIARTVARRPIPILTLDEAQASSRHEIYFWSPALEETAEISARVCERWPDASLLTVRDEAGLSSVHVFHRGKADWQPAIARRQVSAANCRQGLTRVNHHLHRSRGGERAPLPPIEPLRYAGSEQVGQSNPGEPFWMQLRTSDELPRVVDFYAARFSQPKIRTSDGAQFNDTGPDGSGLMVILARRPEGGTEIMIEQGD